MQFQTIQALRFFAAFMVVFYHMMHVSARGEAGVTFNNLLFKIVDVGKAGVPIFFVISGFVMYQTSRNSFQRPGASVKFLLRRIIRIFPIYWICAALYLAFPIAAAPDQGAGIYAKALLLIPGYSSTIIPPGWTLSFELYFYAVFSLLLFLPRRLAVAGLALFFLLSYGIGAALLGDGTRSPMLAMATNIQLFLFLGGVLIGFALQETQTQLLRNGLLISVVGWLGVGGLMASPFVEGAGVPDAVAYGGPALAIVAAAVFGEHAGTGRGWISRFAWLGDSSYALYLIHWLVLFHGAWAFTMVGDGPVQVMLTGIFLSLACVAVGIGLNVGIENPLLKRMRRAVSA